MAYQPPAYGDYTRQKADVNYKFGRDSINNAYGRFISQQRGDRQLGDMYRGYQRNTPIYNSQFGARGLAGAGIKSGVQQYGQNNFIGDFARDYGRQQQDNTMALQGFDLNQADLEAWKQQQLAAIDANKQRDIANDASQIEYLRNLVGGL